MLAFLLGCGLRRGELLALAMRSIQLREEHWVIADLISKAGHIRTIPIPGWAKGALNDWTTASGITEGCIFRSINKAGRIWGNGMTPKVLWEVVRQAAKAAEIERLAPHDLRRYAESRTMPNRFKGCALGVELSHQSDQSSRHRPKALRGSSGKQASHHRADSDRLWR